ncbi:MAG: hydrogenase maturation protease [Methylophilaceae bacterium]|nr:hydrogenase maturation protease [Methylophilaceae bacterium]
MLAPVLMVAPILIVAVGNESRGDDALGPLLLRKLNDELANKDDADQFELLEEFQLQVEHAMDMHGRQLVLFIDAGMNTQDPFAFYRAQPSDSAVLYSHALAPEALLQVYMQLYQEVPPEVFVLCIRGEQFELGEELTPQAVERLALAFEFSKKLLQERVVTGWKNLCASKC